MPKIAVQSHDGHIKVCLQLPGEIVDKLTGEIIFSKELGFQWGYKIWNTHFNEVEFYDFESFIKAFQDITAKLEPYGLEYESY